MSPNRYPVDREIGRGEMGVVYLARDPRLARHLAVKILTTPSGLSSEHADEFRLRFLREAKAAASLSHPGIVTVYDAGDENGDLFIAMELVQGETLGQRIQRLGRLAPGEALSIVSSIADALQAAHERGIVHRDIKPANILLRAEDDAVKIADFGVARLPGSELTRCGTALGSPAYMSPEQIDGLAAGPQSDMFSLAVITYECLCGRRPFSGATLPALTWAIKNVDPDPIGRHLGARSLALEGFFEKALAKSPSARFTSADEFCASLKRALALDGSEARPRNKDMQAKAIMALSALMVVAVGLAVGGRLMHRADLEPDNALVPAASMAGPKSTPQAEAAPSPVARKERPSPSSSLRLRVKNSIPSGSMSLIVDGKTVYTRRLSAPSKKRLLSKWSEKFETELRVPAGGHEVTARVRGPGGSRYESRMNLDTRVGQTRDLHLVLRRGSRAPVTLEAH